MTAQRPIRLAIEGCGHGTLNAIYASVAESCRAKGWSNVDLLIIGGDFQAARNTLDLNCMAVPVKYRAIGDFHEYYSGKRLAPCLTLFVGGNHEASNYLTELHHGGWVAPNIYYLGAANVVRFGTLRIASLSGIWKGYNYRKQHHERLPYNSDDVRSIYHVRELDTRKLLQLRTQVDIAISHDWPRGVEWKGDHKWLFRKKDQFEAEAKEGSLGSVAAKLVLDRLRPRYWFSAHLHIKYAAIVDHKNPDILEDNLIENGEEINVEINDDGSTQPTKNKDEIDLDDSDTDLPTQSQPEHPALDAAVANPVSAELRAQLPSSFSRPKVDLKTPQAHPEPPPPEITNTQTHFLALDKCMRHRDFLQLLSLPQTISSTTPPHLSYDPEWLAITRVFATSLCFGDPSASTPPDRGQAHYRPLIETEEAWVDEHITQADKLAIPVNFTLTAPIYDPAERYAPHIMPREYANPQTQKFCELLGIKNAFAVSDGEAQTRLDAGPREAPDRGGRGRARGGRSRGSLRGRRGR